MKRTSLPLLASVLTAACALLPALPGHAQPFHVEHVGTYHRTTPTEIITEIVAYDPASKLMYAAAGTDAKIAIIDVSNPATPVTAAIQGGEILISTIEVGYTDVNSVSIKNGVLAAAVSNAVGTQPGKVFFFNAATGAFLGSVESGVLPDMLTFTPDGTKVLVANEAELSSGVRGGAGDPEGSVTVISFTGGAAVSIANATNPTALQLPLTGFNGQEEDLRRRGVRIFPTVSAAQDLEPEYIAVSPDGTEARVTLQEASAFAVIKNLNTPTPTITEIQPLQSKDFSKGLPHVQNFAWNPNVIIGTTGTGQTLKLGGFSGLHFEGYNGTKLRLLTITDRGPNGEPSDYLPATPGQERPFALPAYQPRMVRFEFDPATGQFTLLNQIPLFKPDGTTPMTGLPNMTTGNQNDPYVDEVPIDLNKNIIPNDPVGIDTEGVVSQAGADGVIGTIDDIFWAVDEYRVAILKFQAQPGGAKLIKRYVPVGTAAANGGTPLDAVDVEALPAVYAQRRPNRGFEAVALDATLGKVYAFIQSPLDNPEAPNNGTSTASRNLRIAELDITSETVTGEYLYVLDNVSGSGTSKADKIADAVSLGNGRFLAIERDDRTDGLSAKLAYEVDLKGATNISDPASDDGLTGGQSFENLNVNQLAALTPPVYPAWKRAVANLGAAGYTGVSKLEGFTRINETTWVVINDNDFQMAGTIAGNGSASLNPNPEPIQLGLVTFDQSNGIDASDRENGATGAIQIVNRPVFGLPMPDAIASYTVGGQTYYLTANEGDDRGDVDRISTAGFVLDAGVFPNAATLKNNAVLGRLNASNIEGLLDLEAGVTTTRIDGDYDLDGDFDALYSIGTRSFTIWNAQGKRVYDSGDDFERITAELVPAKFNSDGAAASFDTRSDNKGPEPEGATIGVINGRTYAFIALERTSGIIAYDVTDPLAPEFVQYFDHAGDVAPEGLIFMPAGASPFGDQAGLAVANEEVNSKRISLYRIDLQPRVVSVTATSPAGRYAAGDEILVSVNFDQDVTVTGSPELTLNIGGFPRIATFVSAEGNTLTFRYIVEQGDNVADLDYLGEDSLDLVGGTITGATSNLTASIALPVPGATGSLAQTSAIVIDTVQGVILLTGTYAHGDDGTLGKNTNNLPAGYLYNKFHGVVTNGASRLAFSAEVASAFGKGKLLTGFWADDFGAPRLLARQDQVNPAVGTNLFTAFPPTAFATDLFSADNDLAVFRANVTKLGFSFWQETIGGLNVLALPNDHVVQPFLKTINPGAIDAAGKSYFTATFVTNGTTNANNDSGVIKGGVAGDDALVALEGQSAPGADGAIYGQFAGRVTVTPTGVVAYVAPLKKGADANFTPNSDTALFVGINPTKLVRENDAADGVTSGVFAVLGRPALNAAGKVTFAAAVRAVPGTTLVKATNDTGIWSDLTGTVKLVAREGDVARDKDGNPIGTVLDNDQVFLKELRAATPLITDDLVIFSASLQGKTVKTTNDVALFSWDGTTLKMIVREGEVAKGARDNALIDTITTYATNPAGHVAFAAKLRSAVATEPLTKFNDNAIIRTDAAAVNPTIIFRTGDSVSPAPGMPALFNIRALSFLPGSGGADGWGRSVDDLGGIATVLTFQGNVQGIGLLDGADEAP